MEVVFLSSTVRYVENLESGKHPTAEAWIYTRIYTRKSNKNETSCGDALKTVKKHITDRPFADRIVPTPPNDKRDG